MGLCIVWLTTFVERVVETVTAVHMPCKVTRMLCMLHTLIAYYVRTFWVRGRTNWFNASEFLRCCDRLKGGPRQVQCVTYATVLALTQLSACRGPAPNKTIAQQMATVLSLRVNSVSTGVVRLCSAGPRFGGGHERATPA